MNTIQLIWSNKVTIVALAACIVAIYVFIRDFCLLPNDERLIRVKEWLLYAVTEAEKELGSGTGKLKLRKVYDMFLDKFGDISRLITFDMFSEMVDGALEEMRKLLETNKDINEYVYGNEDVSKEGEA